MAKTDDPFERAVAREEQLRRRGAAFDSPSGFFDLAMRWLAVVGAGWALLLTLHWLVLRDPRWLVVAHTVVFALVVGYWSITLSFITFVRRRRPDLFRDE